MHYFEIPSASVVYWSEFLATDAEVRVRFPALPHFLRSSGSGTGSTQPRTTEELLGRKSSGSGLESREYCLGIRHADHATPSARSVLLLRGLRPRSLFLVLFVSRSFSAVAVHICVTEDMFRATNPF
jgi:hypothetical protein